MAVQVGLDGVLLIAATGGVGGTLVAVDNARDVNITCSRGEADISTRGTGGIRALKGTLLDIAFEFQLLWDSANTQCQVLRDAFLDGTMIGVRALDATGGEGPQADCVVFGFDKAEALEEGQMISVVCKPTNPPNFSWFDTP